MESIDAFQSLQFEVRVTLMNAINICMYIVEYVLQYHNLGTKLYNDDHTIIDIYTSSANCTLQHDENVW